MSTARVTTIAYHNNAALVPRRWELSLWRALVLGLLFSIIFLPEFARDGTSTSGLSAYARLAGGFRVIDVAIFLLALCHLAAHACLRNKSLRIPRPLILPGLAFAGCIAMAAWYGNNHGGNNFFFDWRGLALGIPLYLVWSFWLQTPADVTAAVRLFAIYTALRIALLYLMYFVGYRDNLLGVQIPIFDGPVLSCIVFAGLLACSCQEDAGKSIDKLFWYSLALGSYLMVLLCFRRTYWGELGIGTGILLLLQRSNRIRNLVLLVCVMAAAAGLLGASFAGRLQSLDVVSDGGQFSADNADHLFDLMDAWYQVRQSPVMGIGLGTSYRTWDIKNWKRESVMVHNAPLHVWLKYGIAGLTCYLWFHIALLRWLYRRARGPASCNRVLVRAAFAYLAAQFLVTLGFAPWPYSELQLTTLMSFILAAVVAADQSFSDRFSHQRSDTIPAFPPELSP